MATHTKLTENDIVAISDKYELDILRWQPIAGGEENSSFLLSTHQGGYVLTFFEKKSFAGAEQMAQLLNHLTAHGYHTNQVVPTVDDNPVSAYQGKPLVVKTWIPGDTLRDTTQTDYRSIGSAIAELHKIPAPNFLPKEHPFGMTKMPASLNHHVDLEYEIWLGNKLDYIKSSFPADLTKAFIHSDLFDDNIIYHQGQFQAIIDFADACYYPRAYDLGSVLFGACMQDGVLDLEHSGEVLKGYQEIIPLDHEEQDAIQFFAVYMGAAISAWHYLNTYIRPPADLKEYKYKLAAQRTEHILRLPPADFDKVLARS